MHLTTVVKTDRMLNIAVIYVRNVQVCKMYIQSGVAQSVQRLGYELGDKGIVVRLPAGERISFFHQSISIGVWTPNNLSLRGGPFSVLWRPEHEGNNSHPFCAEVKNMWIYTSASPPYAFLSWPGAFSP